jgi:DNA-binding Lrp family transcriptional regulator
LEKGYILISCEIGTEHDLNSKLKEIEGIKNSMITYGNYDIVAEAETENSTKMDELITSKIRRLEKIRTSITLKVSS